MENYKIQMKRPNFFQILPENKKYQEKEVSDYLSNSFNIWGDSGRFRGFLLIIERIK